MRKINSILVLVLLFVVLFNTGFIKDNSQQLVGNWEFDYRYDLRTNTKRCTFFNADSSINSWSMTIKKKSFNCVIDCAPLMGKYVIHGNSIKFSWDSMFDYTDVCDDGKSCLNPSVLKKLMNKYSKYEVLNDTILNIYLDNDQEYYSFIKF